MENFVRKTLKTSVLFFAHKLIDVRSVGSLFLEQLLSYGKSRTVLFNLDTHEASSGVVKYFIVKYSH